MKLLLGVALLVAAPSLLPGAETHVPRPQHADALRFTEGTKASFLGLFTHVEPHRSLAEKLDSLNRVVANNPHISGFTLKIQWRQLHPEKDVWDWEGLERLVAAAAAADKLVNLALIPGAGSPEWIYADGVQRAGPFEFGRQNTTAPLPWDPRFIDLYRADLRELAARYRDDPRVFLIEVLGHNYNPGGEEMHAPSVEAMQPYGWTKERVLENWRFWIDEYAALFPTKKLSLVVSQMYRGAGMELPERVAAYFVERCAGRAVLQTHQLTGRNDRLAESGAICRAHARVAPNCHEMLGSFKEQPERQGSPEMTVFNVKQAGDNVLFLQLWRRDCEDPAYARALLTAWENYRDDPLDRLKEKLVASGVFLAAPPPE